MAKRSFGLPGIHELSKDQEEAIRLPLDGCHLVIGGPGTGKTVVALLRLRRYHQQTTDRNIIFLVYNHLLHSHAKQLFGEGIESSTWMRWFCKTYLACTQREIPKIETTSKFKPIDWNLVVDMIDIKNFSEEQEKPYIIIDEGQDMPPQFYDTLIQMGFEKFYVVADQNQAITSDNSSREQIQDAFGLEIEDIIELKENYRNSFPIARLAKAFYTDDPASPTIKLPPKKAFAQTPYLIEYGKGCKLDFENLIKRILKHADRDPRKLIGIITPNDATRKKYFTELKRSAFSNLTKLDNGSPKIETYFYGQKKNVRFDEGGIIVINAQSCKGLEFDSVFVADIHEFTCGYNFQDYTKRLFYVMIARAIERVFLLREAGAYCPVEDILPKDSEVLMVWRGSDE